MRPSFKFRVIFTLILFNGVISSSVSYYDKFIKDQNSYRMFFRLPNYRGIKKTILCDMDNNTDVALKQSIIDGIYYDQSVILTKCTKDVTKSIMNMNILMTKDINIVLITSDFNKIIITKHLKHSIFLFNKSLVYLIITRVDDNFICSNGKFTPKVFNEIQNWMNEFWHTYKIFKVVVIFPFTCLHKYVVYDGRKPSNKSFYDRTIKLLNTRNFENFNHYIVKNSNSLSQGYPLKASIFDRFPTSILSCDKINDYVNWNSGNTDGFCGLDGLVLNDLVNFFGFNVTFPKDKECERFGYRRIEDNTTGGSLGCVIRGKIDVSFNSRFQVHYTDQEYFYLHHVTSDSLCALLKQPDFVPLWLYPYAFKESAWLFMLVLVVFLSVSAWIFTKLSGKIKGGRTKKFCHYVFHTCTSTFFGFAFDKLSNARIIRGTCLLCSIVFIAIYQGHINYCFTTVAKYEKIKTLNELYKSGVTLFTSTSIKTLIKNSESPNDPNQKKFLAKAKVYNRTNIGAILKNSNAATMVRRADSYLEIMMKYTDSQQRPLLYIVDECFNLYYLSYIARVGFPFADELKLFMQHLVEAGLPKMYYTWTAQSLGIINTMPKDGIEKRPISKITLGDQRIAFGLLFVGYLLATIAFVLEKLLIFGKVKCIKIKRSIN